LGGEWLIRELASKPDIRVGHADQTGRILRLSVDVIKETKRRVEK
jgi:hypothetical protein